MGKKQVNRELYLTAIKSKYTFIKVYAHLFGVLTTAESLLLGVLEFHLQGTVIAESRKDNPAVVDIDDWFYCHNNRLAEDTSRTVRSITMIISSLEQKGMIQTEMRNHKSGSQRYIKILWDNVFTEPREVPKKISRGVPKKISTLYKEHSKEDKVPKGTSTRERVEVTENSRKSRKKRNSPTKQDTLLAQRLKEAINPNSKRIDITNKSWAGGFHRLREQDGCPQEEISKVLNWFCSNHKHYPSITISNGYRFWAKYSVIKRMMDKHRSNGQAPKTLILPGTKKFASDLANGFRWPPNITEHLPGIVQRAYNLRSKMHTVAEKLNCTGYEFLRRKFINDWLESRCKKMTSYNKWKNNPNTKALELTLDRDDFESAAIDELCSSMRRRAAIRLWKKIKEQV